ncbi:amino acid permease [Gemella sp. GH3]|uniref:APC family permease n=1 Tax=unclassified Gemella TaxID=2624949 RepID=UPI0015D02C6C|nr:MULTISPECIES: amino acid permease [unclassified Gemella]MBF0714088.1 amino acid permease [Gemella sp. GH3.1]NYS51040.1 amino acid permease [Gemella sp. GH3]
MNNELKKNIGFFPAFATVMGTVIGAGVFFKAAIIYKTTGSVSLGMLAWVLGGIITLCAGLTAAELAASIPETGGMIVWIERTYGKTAAYLLGWTQGVIYMPANIAALAIIFSTQVLNLFNINVTWHIPIAILAATSIIFLNFLGSKASSTLQVVTTICKLIPIGLIIVFGLIKGDVQSISLLPTSENIGGAGGNTISLLGTALLATMFAYDGWINVGAMAGEMKNPKKDLPRAIIFGLTAIMVVYVLINIAFVTALPISEIAGNPNAASDVAVKLFGPFGGKLITIGILVSVYGTINGYTMAGIRIPYTLAKENLIPKSNLIAKLNKHSIPVNSGLIIWIVSVVMIFSGQFDMLTDLLLFVIWMFYTLTFLAVIILRKKEPELIRPYRVPLYPIIPGVAIIGGLFILVNTLLTQTLLALGGTVLMLIGLFFYKELINKYK